MLCVVYVQGMRSSSSLSHTHTLKRMWTTGKRVPYDFKSVRHQKVRQHKPCSVIVAISTETPDEWRVQRVVEWSASTVLQLAVRGDVEREKDGPSDCVPNADSTLVKDCGNTSQSMLGPPSAPSHTPMVSGTLKTALASIHHGNVPGEDGMNGVHSHERTSRDRVFRSLYLVQSQAALASLSGVSAETQRKHCLFKSRRLKSRSVGDLVYFFDMRTWYAHGVGRYDRSWRRHQLAMLHPPSLRWHITGKRTSNAAPCVESCMQALLRRSMKIHEADGCVV